MWLFLTLQLLVLVDFCIILQQSASTWVFWVFIGEYSMIPLVYAPLLELFN
jgi:hypothetical protein